MLTIQCATAKVFNFFFYLVMDHLVNGVKKTMTHTTSKGPNQDHKQENHVPSWSPAVEDDPLPDTPLTAARLTAQSAEQDSGPEPEPCL